MRDLLSALVEPALLFDSEGRLAATNDSAEALDARRLEGAWRPVVDAARSEGIGRAVLVDPERDDLLVATARRSEDGTTLLLLVRARGAASVERRPFVENLIHELRNQSFALDVHAEELGRDGATRAVRAVGQRLARIAQGLSEWIEPAIDAPEAYGVLAVLHEIAQQLRAAHPSTFLTVTGAPEAQALGRRGCITQALRCVLENAMQVAPSGTVVEVEVRTGDAHHALTVRDRGPGLPRGAELRVWEPLYRRRKGGLGVGLAIAKRHITDDGGRVRAENAVGGGALFTLELPRAP